VHAADPPFVRQGAISSEDRPALGHGPAHEGLVGDVGLVGAVEAEDTQPPRQGAEHRIGEEARWLGTDIDAHTPLAPDAGPAGTVDRATELEERDVVLASAARTGNTQGRPPRRVYPDGWECGAAGEVRRGGGEGWTEP
jgi:hypothetical protein